MKNDNWKKHDGYAATHHDADGRFAPAAATATATAADATVGERELESIRYNGAPVRRPVGPVVPQPLPTAHPSHGGNGHSGQNLRIQEINEQVQHASAWVRPLQQEVSRVVVGQKHLIDRLLVGLLTNGHILLEGVPGLAKTLSLKTLAAATHLKFKRLQFTPDMLPADIVGTMIYNPRDGSFHTKHGPVFANFILADEINRAPAKVQSALLEAMQERQVTIGDTTYPLPEPFVVMATQNPIEQEGTYPLPEAQVDRFMLMVKVGYLSREEERTVMDRMTSAVPVTVRPTTTPEQLLAARKVVRDVYTDDRVKDYIVNIVFATREPERAGLKELAPLIEYGASPRASIALNMAARAHAFLRHRGYVTPEDVKAVGPDVLRHRVVLSYEAEAEEVTAEEVVRKVFEVVEVP
jgi:MoxR-like ATPase